MSFERYVLGKPSTRLDHSPYVKIRPCSAKFRMPNGRAQPSRLQIRQPITKRTATSVTSPVPYRHNAARPSERTRTPDADLTHLSSLRMIWVYRCLDLPDRSTNWSGRDTPYIGFCGFGKGRCQECLRSWPPLTRQPPGAAGTSLMPTAACSGALRPRPRVCCKASTRRAIPRSSTPAITSSSSTRRK